MRTPSRRLTLAAIFSSTLGVGLIFGFQPPLIALTLAVWVIRALRSAPFPRPVWSR